MTVRVPGEGGVPPGARQRGLGTHLGRDVGRPDPPGDQASGELGEAEEAPLTVAEARHRRRIAHGPAPDEVDVQADLQVGLGARQGRGFGRGREGHEERRRPHHATPVGLEDAARHSGREPEVVRRDDHRHGS